MKNIVFYTLLMFSISFANIGQAQITTKGIDLSYLQQLVQRKSTPKNINESSSEGLESFSFNSNPSPRPKPKHKTDLSTKVFNLKAGSDTFHVSFLEVFNKNDLRVLSAKLENSNYPLTILHKDVFTNYSQLLLEYDLLIYKYKKLEETGILVQGFQEKEIEKLKSIILLEKEKAHIIKKSRDEILTQVDYLNKELDNTVKIQTKARKRNFGKTFLTGAIGGAVGLAAGVLLMEFAR